MSARRRTQPRSQRISAAPSPQASPPSSFPSARHASSPGYAPTFSATTPSRAPARQILESPPPSSLHAPAVYFGSAPLASVRWLEASRGDALAAVGSCGGAADTVSLYEVGVVRGEGVVAKEAVSVPHPGRVTGMVAGVEGGEDGAGLAVCSSDGGVRVLRGGVDGAELVRVGGLPKTGGGVGGGLLEPAAGVCVLGGGRLCAAGGAGSLVVVDVEKAEAAVAVSRGDAVGFRGISAVDPDGGDLVVAAGASGVAGVWDFRERRGGGWGADGERPTQELRHPERGVGVLGVAVDAAQPHFVLGGTSSGELAVWDRRGGDGGLPLGRVALHDGAVWDVRVVRSSRPGLLLSCGEDGRVWLMDFAAAAARSAVAGAGAAWRDSGEFWRAELAAADVRNVAAPAGATLGVNAVDAHPRADLFAYAGDSAAVTFGSLYSNHHLAS